MTAKKQVIIGFKLSDPYSEAFTFERGKRQGQQSLSIKGRLLKVKFVRIDGQPISLPAPAERTQAAA